MSNAVVMLPVRATVSGRWQIPVFFAGIGLFAVGLHDIVSGYHPRTFQEDVTDIGLLRSAGQQPKAYAFITDLLQDEERPALERAELLRLLAATIHDAESPLAVHEPRNTEAILSNFQLAVRLGLSPGWMDWVMVADAYGWQGRFDEAVDALRQALRLGPDRADDLRRRMIEMMFAAGEEEPPEVLGLLDAILGDDAASPRNYLWALDLRVDQLLSQGDLTGATVLADQGGVRLAGTPEGMAVDFSKARCLYKAGKTEEAERTLRSLRNQWQVEDELWGRAGWLLGRIQEEDARPQEGLAFLEDVLTVFQSGDLHEACQFWRGQCLAMLERHEKAQEVFSRLMDAFAQSRRFRQYDLNRSVLRSVLSVWGESLLQTSATEPEEKAIVTRVLGLRYLRMALALADTETTEVREGYLRRIAGGLGAMAASAEASGAAQNDGEARQYHDEAAEAYLELAKLTSLDDDEAADALWLAADHLDRAGRQDRTIELLASFVVDRPNSDRRLAALFRLGQAYQSASRYVEAADAYQKAIDGYLPSLDAQRSLVPLAQCLIRRGGEHARRGVQLLLNLVQDKLPNTLLEPAAREYKEALFQLGEYYAQADEKSEPHHSERAIEWLEEATAFYPDDPRVPKLKFLLADSYRRSARALQDERAGMGNSEAKAAASAGAKARLDRALMYFSDVVAALASQDESELSALERTQLRAGYLYRGDCLFDLGRYEDAIAAYQEAAWRYENQPAAVMATLQVIHCHQRLGQREEALAALGRARWLIRTIPEAAFEEQAGMPTRSYWEDQVGRLTTMLSDQGS